MTYIRASELGCALDCDLKHGRNKYTGGSATDDGPRINAAMAQASASNPIMLIIDGSALISGLFLPAGGSWAIAGLGCGTGFFVKTGTNNDGIHNGPPSAGNPSDPGPPAPPRGSSVSLSNFTLNGNQGNGQNGDSTTGAPQGVIGKQAYCGINLMNLNNITLENVVVVNSPAYHIRLSNVGNVAASGCIMQTFGPNTDGLHFDGPANDITISNCSFVTGDDAIALNCPEGNMGDISRVKIQDCSFRSQSLARLNTIAVSGSPDKFYIDTVEVNNCSGIFTGSAFPIGDGAGSNPRAVTGLNIDNCTLTAPTILDLYANFGTINLSNVVYIPLHANPAPGYAFARTSAIYEGMTYVGVSLSFANCVIQRNTGAPVAALILESGSTIETLQFNGFIVQELGIDNPTPELVNILSGSIDQLVFNDLISNSVKAPVSKNGFASIGRVSGAGVLATNWEFPDNVMADGVPYISETTGKPSIKINGVVQPYP